MPEPKSLGFLSNLTMSQTLLHTLHRVLSALLISVKDIAQGSSRGSSTWAHFIHFLLSSFSLFKASRMLTPEQLTAACILTLPFHLKKLTKAVFLGFKHKMPEKVRRAETRGMASLGGLDWIQTSHGYRTPGH